MKKTTIEKLLTDLLEVFERQLKFDLEGLQIQKFSRPMMGTKTTYYLVDVPKIEYYNQLFREDKLQEALQSWLEKYILPQNHIAPYTMGEESFPRLYIEWVICKPDSYSMYITDVSNDTTFKYMKYTKKGREKNESSI